ncbi:MAG TPA: glycosyl transferase family A, partial [Cyanobacteria bacterium UBA11162]|nr:glycosyl transferase family A [Cyanobacteria bacterium UBA11162]
GLAQLLRFLPAEGTLAFQKLLASFQGRWQGLQTWQQCDRS